jgi:putative transposase
LRAAITIILSNFFRSRGLNADPTLRLSSQETNLVRTYRIQRIALEHRRRYGYRRITAELHRRGVQVNRKKVARMMRDDNLLVIQPKRFVVTTNSNLGAKCT